MGCRMTIVYTIGYEGTDIDRFVATLKAVGVDVLADVRALALSRKKGFSKKSLKARLESEGISYLHFVDLGDPKPGREAARAGQHAKFREIYSKHLRTSRATGALDELTGVVKERVTCLLCFERDPTVCHRSIVGEKLKTAGVDVFDLYGDLPSRYANHSSKFAGRHTRQGVAAA